MEKTNFKKAIDVFFEQYESNVYNENFIISSIVMLPSIYEDINGEFSRQIEMQVQLIPKDYMYEKPKPITEMINI